MTLMQQLQLLIDAYVCQICDWRATQTDDTQPPYKMDIPDMHQRSPAAKSIPLRRVASAECSCTDYSTICSSSCGDRHVDALSGSQCLSYSGTTSPQGLPPQTTPGLPSRQPPPLRNLYVRMLQRLGIETDNFGTSTGTLTGLQFADG